MLLLLPCLLLVHVCSANVPFRRWGNKAPGNPVVLVPGDGGSQLEANLTGKPEVVHYICSKTTAEFFDLWLNLQLFVPQVIDCWVDNMKLVYNITTGRSSNMPGVDIRIPGFGDTKSIEWLDKSKASPGNYFSTLVEALVSWGYSRGKDIIGAPYDWRKSPVELHEYYLVLKTTIETTYRYNNNKKVVVVGHSMGNPVMLYFYKEYCSKEWKEKYIQSHVSIAAPWGGSMQIIRLYAAGYNMNYYRVILSPFTLREMQRSFTSSALLFPSKYAWGPGDVIAMTDTKNYTVNDAKEFFYDINYPIGWQQYKNNGNGLLGDLSPPGIDMHCVYGTGMETPELFKWAKGYFPDYQPEVINGDGDGTVNAKSGKLCLQWNETNNQGKKVTHHEVEKAEHMAILQHPQSVEIVRKAVYGEM